MTKHIQKILGLMPIQFEIKDLQDKLHTYPRITLLNIDSFTFEDLNAICELQDQLKSLRVELEQY